MLERYEGRRSDDYLEPDHTIIDDEFSNEDVTQVEAPLPELKEEEAHAEAPPPTYVLGPARNGMPSSIRYQAVPGLERPLSATDFAAPKSDMKRVVTTTAILAGLVGGVCGYSLGGSADSPPPVVMARQAAIDDTIVPVAALAEPDAQSIESDIAAGSSASECRASLTSTPGGAAIFHQGTLLGATPFDGAIPCDAEGIAFLHPGFVKRQAPLEWDDARKSALAVTLERPIYTVTVRSIPRKVAIKKDGEFVGMSPVVLQLPAFEPAHISAAKQGFQAQTNVEIIPTEATSTTVVELEPYVAPN